MVPDDALAGAEETYLDARDLLDRLNIARVRGDDDLGLAGAAASAVADARAAIDDLAEVDTAGWDSADLRALTVLKRWSAAVDVQEDTWPGTDESWVVTAGRGFAALSARLQSEYAAAQGAVDTGEVIMTRLAVLERLAVEPDAEQRRHLFLSLEPVWQSIDGDDGYSSPYRRLIEMSARRWAAGGSPVERNARALGIDPAGIDDQLVAILSTWRAASGGTPVQPWDWWFVSGAASRALATTAPLQHLRDINDAWHSALGADPAELAVGYDIVPRPGRPPVPVAFTDFGARPRRLPGGGRHPARAWVMAAYTGGGLGELTELVHETGHAIHIAAIDTRPAFADWPDSDAFTEALAELTALDTAEPAWQGHWLGTSLPEAVSLRGRYADVMLDICWALLEIRLHADPDLWPSEVWAELTSTYLGITEHPELSWWAMRGQLVQEPGYMVNYALGPIIAADLRAAIRAERGDWSAGDPGWYGWVSEHVYRWGLERTSAEVLTGVLGRAPTADALLAEVARAA